MGKSLKSHAFTHMKDYHPEEALKEVMNPSLWTWKVYSSPNTVFERVVKEAVMIKLSMANPNELNLNGREEFGFYELPEVSINGKRNFTETSEFISETNISVDDLVQAELLLAGGRKRGGAQGDFTELNMDGAKSSKRIKLIPNNDNVIPPSTSYPHSILKFANVMDLDEKILSKSMRNSNQSDKKSDPQTPLLIPHSTLNPNDSVSVSIPSKDMPSKNYAGSDVRYKLIPTSDKPSVGLAEHNKVKQKAKPVDKPRLVQSRMESFFHDHTSRTPIKTLIRLKPKQSTSSPLLDRKIITKS